jgi:predicted enzyme related to lactoylglutathione lyase
MSDDKLEVGTIMWRDLTVEDAPGIRDFYSEVVGWKPESVSMGEYDDFNMKAPASGDAMAGVCHARGTNSGLPAQWLNYVVVDDLDRSARRCKELGGEILVEPKGMGGHTRYCVIRDPAGAVLALTAQSASEPD